MSRLTLSVFGILLVIILVMTGRASCAGKADLPFLGKWKGGFVADRFVGRPNAFGLRRSGFDATLQLYRTEDKFILHLEAEQETVDVLGTWTHKDREIRLKVGSVDVDDMGGSDARDPNRPFVDAEAIRQTYSGILILRMTKDKKQLIGLPLTLGEVVGTHRFKKDSPG
jgi:hypothetical protein